MNYAVEFCKKQNLKLKLQKENFIVKNSSDKNEY